MNKKRTLFIFLIFVLSVSIITLFACSPQKRPAPTQPAPAPAPAPNMDTAKNNEMAEMLADKISQMEEVNSATVVMSDKRAWVGIDLKADESDTMTDMVKNEITDTVKKTDRSIDTVYVTADADSVTRLRNIARDIANGRPVSGFLDELNEIGRRITPSMR